MSTSGNIIELFQYANEFTKEYITQMELIPIYFGNDVYVSGFKLVDYNKVEVHLKRFQCVKIETLTINETHYITNPQEEIWVNSNLLDQNRLAVMFSEFKTNFFKLNSFDVVKLEYKQEGKPLEEHAIIFDNKRIACKTTLNFKKTHPNTTHKILHFGEQEKKEMTELDIVTSATEEN